jgi:hypothetical protein
LSFAYQSGWLRPASFNASEEVLQWPKKVSSTRRDTSLRTLLISVFSTSPLDVANAQGSSQGSGLSFDSIKALDPLDTALADAVYYVASAWNYIMATPPGRSASIRRRSWDGSNN